MSDQDDPTLREAIDTMLDDRLFGTRTAVLCKVTKTSDTPRPTISAQVGPRKWQHVDGDIKFVNDVELSDVPVMELAWGPLVVRGDIQVGDFGVLLICDRCIDRWLGLQNRLSDPGIYSPANPLIHDLNSALFLPAAQPDAVARQGPKVGARQLVIGARDGSTKITLDGVSKAIDIDSTLQVNLNAPKVNIGNVSPAQGAHSVARVGVDYVVCGTPGTAVPILPGTALPVPVVPPAPGLPSAHKVRG
jgi:hypothetical protein